MSLERELSQLRAPDERAAQQRAWSVLRAAPRGRTPVNRRRSSRLVALPPAVIAVIAVIAALALTPAGASVSRLIGRALGVPHAVRALVPLPARGRLLVSAPAGTWIVSADGSQRRLGPWREASWFPHGLYIAVATRDEIPARRHPVGAQPTGGLRSAPVPAHRLPCRLPVRQYAARCGRRRQRRPAPRHRCRRCRSRLAAGSALPAARLLVLSQRGARLLTGTGRTVISIAAHPGPLLDGSLSPDGHALALVCGGSAPGVALARLGSSRPRLSTLLSGPGMQQVLWLPNGRWLAISWPAADQWAFVAVAGEPRIAAASRIAQQFHHGSRPTGFPRLDGWCCTLRGSAG